MPQHSEMRDAAVIYGKGALLQLAAEGQFTLLP